MTNFKMILESEEFKTKIEAAAEVSDVVSILAEYGIQATEEELLAAIPTGELSEDDLDHVTGSGDIIRNLAKLNPFYWLAKWYVESSLTELM